jgi:hypothetical protein
VLVGHKRHGCNFSPALLPAMRYGILPERLLPAGGSTAAGAMHAFKEQARPAVKQDGLLAMTSCADVDQPSGPAKFSKLDVMRFVMLEEVSHGRFQVSNYFRFDKSRHLPQSAPSCITD